MKTKIMPVAKTAIQELSGDQLEMLKAFGKSDEYKILEQLTEREKYLRYQHDLILMGDGGSVDWVKGVIWGMSYMMDCVNRAKTELKSRGSEVDNK